MVADKDMRFVWSDEETVTILKLIHKFELHLDGNLATATWFELVHGAVLCLSRYLRELRPLPADWHQTIGVGAGRCGGGTPSNSNHLWLSIPACCSTLVTIFMPYDWCL